MIEGCEEPDFSGCGPAMAVAVEQTRASAMATAKVREALIWTPPPR